MNPSPFFSIVIPTYNRAALVIATIHSILKQELPDFEIIVVDDGSNDDTETRISGIKDPRLFFHRKENGERGAARNYGARIARGTYINFFDSDDLMYPNHLATAKKLIGEKNSPEFFHLGYDFKKEDGTLTSKVDRLDDSVRIKAMFDNFLSCNGVFVRKDIAQQFPFEEARVLASAEDWELWIRLLSRYQLQYSNAITSTVVNHDERSIRTIPTDKIIARDMFLIEALANDKAVLSAFGKKWNKFVAERYTFFMLCLAEDGRKSEVRKWAVKAAGVYPMITFSSRFLASLKRAF
ncbi:MAG: glycosyltransferase family A protein [Bacteroidota bacterium]